VFGASSEYASYWLTNQPSLTAGQNVLFNLQQNITRIEYDPTTGVFTVPSGVYAIDFFATPSSSYQNTLNVNVNGAILPTPSLSGAMVVMPFSNAGNHISVQATGNWSPQTEDLGSYFFAYSSIAIYRLQLPNAGGYACLYSNTSQTLSAGQNVLFQNELSLAGVTYDGTTGVLTLPAGNYSVSYFSYPSGSLNLVANGNLIPNSPLSGSVTILTLSNATNSLALQAPDGANLSESGTNQCNAMITVYRINK
jgi:hypothetical protein